MTTSMMLSAKKNSSACTDQPVLLKMENAIQLVQQSMDAEMSKLGNGGIRMINISNMLQVYCHQLQGELLTMVMLKASSSGLILVPSPKVLLIRSMEVIIKLLSKHS